MDEILQQFRSEVAERVHQGFESRDSILEFLTESVQDEHDVVIAKLDATRIVDEELLAHYARQAAWEQPTDCNKLDAAFKKMEERGLVARQHFSCCSNCGRSEMRDEVAAALAVRPVTGYAFFHMQDTEGAVEGGTIYLKYGPTTGTTAEEVGHLICDALEESGLVVGWSGSADDAIEVDLADWRKRRVNELPLTEEPE